MATEATKIPFVEAAAPATPAASRVVVYAKSDGLMYSKDDAGAETLMSSGATGSVAGDGIWDAKGDLAVATAANTAQKLTVGTNGHVLTADSGETTGVKWAASASVTAATTFLTSNVSQVTAGTWYSGPTTGSLSAGTYILHGQLYVDCSSLGNANEESVRIYNGTASVADAAMVFDNTTNRRASIPIGPVVVTPVGATTYTIQATNTSNGGTIKDVLDNNGTADKASWITYIKIA